MLLALASLASVALSECHRRPMPWAHARENRAKSAQLERPGAIPVPEYFHRWRAAYLTANREHDRLGLVGGIFLGDASHLAPESHDVFLNAGLAHLLSANGFKCWIVALVFKLALTLALHVVASHGPALWILHTRRNGAPLARLGGAWLFWFWTCQTPPINRAVILITSKYFLDLFELRVSYGRLLLIQYLCSLVVVPTLAHSAGFQLTYGCIAGIIWFPPLVGRWRPAGGGLAAVWDYLCVSTGAVLGGLPTSIIAFDEINFMSLTTNWFAVPPVSFLVMPLGLLQMLLLAPGLGAESQPALHILIDGLGTITAGVAAVEQQLLIYWLKLVPSLRWP